MIDKVKIKKIMLIRKRNRIMNIGIETGLVKSYSDELLDKAKAINFNGIPLNLYMENTILNMSLCYLRAMQYSYLFDSCEVIIASVKSLSYLSPGDDLHAFVVYDGFVYDSASFAVVEKDYYYKLEGPIPFTISSSEDVQSEFENMNIAKKLSLKKFELETIIFNVKKYDELFYIKISNDYNLRSTEILSDDYEYQSFILDIIKKFAFQSEFQNRIYEDIDDFERKLTKPTIRINR